MKKKGSALILSILMLSFFMTITLTMYYIARNRNKRSIYKIKGMKVSSGLDSGSAIAHYELYIADEYVSRGYSYEVGSTYFGKYGVDTYIGSLSETKQYTEEISSGSKRIIVPIENNHYTGVVLNNYNEYFASYWDPELGTSKVPGVTSVQAIQPWIAEDKVIGSKIISRAWLNNGGEKIVRLWTLDKDKDDVDAISIGGYRLIKSGVENTIPTTIIGNLSSINPTTKTDGDTIFVYEKIVSISSGSIGIENYRVTYKEKITTSGGKIVVDELEEMTVEKLK
ncbi:MAG: hypothetical protein WBG30_07215 [Psychrilyobacter sp.]|uniref:hypothetical protein n=1 Tax=Psychrilyobacter sp. TaxID=2586924 RepID=UPI003C71DF90